MLKSVALGFYSVITLYVKLPCKKTLLPNMCSGSWLSSHLQMFPFSVIPWCQKWSWAHICSQTTWLLWKKLMICWPKETWVAAGNWQPLDICGLWKSLPKVTPAIHGKPWFCNKASRAGPETLQKSFQVSRSCVKVGNSGSSSHVSGDSWQLPLIHTVAYHCSSVVIGCIFTNCWQNALDW